VIQFERTKDYEVVRRIMVHPRIYPHISDDFSPPADQYRPVENEAIWYVLAWNGRSCLGIWMLVPQNGICWEVHTALLPSAWGDTGLRAARLLPEWIWRNTPCRRIITNVPSTNRLALHFAVNAGMTIYGINAGSYLKDGKLCDQTCLGISAPREVARSEAETAPETIGAGEGICRQR
jgi:hypothetical protein